MNLSWVRSFVMVTEAGGFAEAAERLFTTQSTVSKQVMALEKELEVGLLDRSGRRATLTKAGQSLLPLCRALLDAQENLLCACASCRTERSSVLSIAATPVLSTAGMTGLLAAFSAQRPDVRLDMDEREAEGILSALESGRYELALARRETLDTRGLAHLDLLQDRLAAVLPKQHPLAGETKLSLSQMAGENFLLLSRETRMLDFCIRQCEQAGFSPKVGYTGTHMNNILNLVGAGMGVTLAMLQTVAQVGRKDVVVVPLREEIPSAVALLWRKDRQRSEAAMAFCAFAQAQSSGQK